MAALRQLGAVLGAVVAAVGSVLFIAWRWHFCNRTRRGRYQLHYLPLQKDSYDRQVLVLGLDGAGKSSILHYLTTNTVKERPEPTHGFNSLCVNTEGFKIDLLEIGGSPNLRTYWNLYLSRPRVLLFVVDSADSKRFPLVRHELHQLLAEQPELALIVLAHKQDQNDAFSACQMHKELALDRVQRKRKFAILATSLTQHGMGAAKSIQDLRALLVEFLL
ncbi:ADP-ribosylation factor-like protein 10 isoform X2 [Microcaecilia unicolor]|uniref:ADP-ribosylation factor-like protein 10 isoform X2 n=1 Tax=Microcaecilia unicolor TaxID=1415580 RepID=A0A6P7YUP8_9AMPH|nr:ADP-ribosylation factor-like protein 10 isoform X2 [Microcaecilia unicolor]